MKKILMTKTIIYTMLACWLVSITVYAESKFVQLNPQMLQAATQYQKLNFQKSSARVIRDFETQAANDKSEDGEPSGPDNEISPVYLADEFEAVSRHIREDFDNHLPYSDELFRDHSSLHTHYFHPSGYLLKRNTVDGYEINFLHRTREEESEDDLIVLTFTLATRQLHGAIPLVSALADYAIKPLNNKSVDLNRLPVSSVKVSLSGLTSLLPEDNVRVINSPNKVGDDIRVQATMSQSQKEDVVASIRSGGLSGDVTFTTNNNSFELVIPYHVSFTDYAGDWVSDITKLDTSDSIENVSPFPLVFTGVVAYIKPKNSKQIRRYYVPLKEPTLMAPGAIASADKNYQQLFASYGQMVSTWPAYERVSCDECLNAIERDILVSPAMASRTELPIEVIPNVFGKYSLFKILVEVRSSYFSSSGEFEESKTFSLRPDETQTAVSLYLNRDSAEGAKSFEYRIKPLHIDGIESQFSEWKTDGGVMDITITGGDIRPLLPTEENP